eukprot:4269432-Ditylum_brightwellii.AAC.1
MPTLFMFISVAALMMRTAISARLAAMIVPKGGSRPFPDDGTKSADDSVAFSDATSSSTSADIHLKLRGCLKEEFFVWRKALIGLTLAWKAAVPSEMLAAAARSATRAQD